MRAAVAPDQVALRQPGAASPVVPVGIGCRALSGMERGTERPCQEHPRTSLLLLTLVNQL